MGLLRKLQEIRKEQKRQEQLGSSQPKLRVEPTAQKAQEDAEEIECQRREQEAAYNAQQAEQAHRLQEINDKVDQQTTANSEEFLSKIKQPGGQ